MVGVMSNIEITRTFARWIVEHGRRLVSDGLGVNWPPEEVLPLENDDGLNDYPGFLDELDPGSNTWQWANLLIHFARAVTAVAMNALAQDQENDSGSESDTIGLLLQIAERAATGEDGDTTSDLSPTGANEL